MDKATVILFKQSGKYYTEEEWRIPEGAITPHDMRRSPDFRRIGGGAVLIVTQEPWGYPALFPQDDDAAEVRMLREQRDAVLGFLDDVNREEWASKVLISTAIRKAYGLPLGEAS